MPLWDPWDPNSEDAPNHFKLQCNFDVLGRLSRSCQNADPTAAGVQPWCPAGLCLLWREICKDHTQVMERVGKVKARWTCLTQRNCVVNSQSSISSCMELKHLYHSLPSTPTLGPIYCHCFFGTYTRSVSRIFVLQIWSSMLEELQQLPTHSQSDYFCHCSVIFEVFPQMLHQSPRNTVPSCITLSKWSISSVSLVRPQRYNVPSLQWTNTQKGETQSSDIHTVLRKQNKKLHCLQLLSLWNRNMLRSRPTNWLSTGRSISINGYFVCFSISMAYLEATQHSLLFPVGEEANRALRLA